MSDPKENARFKTLLAFGDGEEVKGICRYKNSIIVATTYGVYQIYRDSEDEIRIDNLPDD